MLLLSSDGIRRFRLDSTSVIENCAQLEPEVVEVDRKIDNQPQGAADG